MRRAPTGSRNPASGYGLLVMAEAPQSLFSKPKGNGAETKPAKVHANLGNRTFEQYKALSYVQQMESDREVAAKKKAHASSK